jgi:polysaccharide pyruvyl transferase WcaK-like protein
VVRGLDPVIGRDPAFDYLETRPVELNRITDSERRWIDDLVQETSGRALVGINLRPIRHLYTVADSGQDPVEHTQYIESRFEDRLAEGMRQFDNASITRPCFVFFPMNAIQFGMSDLRSAYRISRRLGKDVDFRVWETDASIDGVVELLRRLDVVITMRFHATIFSLAQNRPVVGIDYRVGKRDKVAALLDDFDQSGNCTRIDLLSADWLCERLCAQSELLQVG